MSAIARFQKYSGKHVLIGDSHVRAYVPKEGDNLEEVVEGSHPNEELEDGYQLAAVKGLFEDGNLVQAEGFIAVSDAEDRAYVCDEGHIEYFEGPASKLAFEIDEE